MVDDEFERHSGEHQGEPQLKAILRQLGFDGKGQKGEAGDEELQETNAAGRGLSARRQILRFVC